MEVGVLYLCFEVCFLLRWSNPVAEAYRNGLVNSIAFIDSHSVGGESRCLNCLCASGFNPTQPRNRWGALSLVVVRNSSSCYLRKLEEALGNNGTGITTTCHVAQFQEPRKSQPATWGRGRARVPFASKTDTDTWLYKSLLTSPSRNLIYLWGFLFLICWSYWNERSMKTTWLYCSVCSTWSTTWHTIGMKCWMLSQHNSQRVTLVALKTLSPLSSRSWVSACISSSLLDIPPGMADGHPKTTQCVQRKPSRLLSGFHLLENSITFYPAAHTRALSRWVLAICFLFHPLLPIPTSTLHSAVQATPLTSTV